MLSGRVRKSLLVLSALLLALTVAQFGPGAPAAFAVKVKNKCAPYTLWDIREINTGTGLILVERCEEVISYPDPITGEKVVVWDWVHYRFKTAPQNQRTLWHNNCDSPGYNMAMSDLMSDGSGGGAAGAKVLLYDCDGNQLARDTGARVVIQYYSTVGVGAWYTCNDSNWTQTSNGRVAAYINQYTQPDCGAADYRALAAGRFWSLTQNKWITRGWIITPSIYLSMPLVATEPTGTPTTPTPATPD
jgi:hypothetical protein